MEAVPQGQFESVLELCNTPGEFNLKNFNLLIVINQELNKAINLNNFCRQNNIAFIYAENYGLLGRYFVDFGK